MGLRFRKSISLGKGLRLNLSKSGLGISGGIRGFRVGVNSRGSYMSAGIPGTGIYTMHQLGKKKAAADVVPKKTSRVLELFIVSVGGFFLLMMLWSVDPVSSYWGAAVFAGGYTAFQFLPSRRIDRLVRKAQKLREKGRTEEAVQLLQQACRINVKNPLPVLVLAETYYLSEKYKESAVCLRALVSRYPENDGRKFLLAAALHGDKQYAEAVSILQDLLKRNPDDLSAILWLAKCFGDDGKPELAIEALKRAPLQVRKLDERLLEAHFLMGKNLEQLGDHSAARKHYQKIYAVNADYEGVREALDRLEDANAKNPEKENPDEN